MKKKLLLATATILALSACTPSISQRGNKVEDYQIEELVVNIHTRTDVLRIMGSPTTKAPFDDRTWYYIGQEMQKRGILDPSITDERIVMVKFTDDGTLKSVKDVETQRLDVPLENDSTQTHGNDISVLQQFLGNLGRFNPQTVDQ